MAGRRAASVVVLCLAWAGAAFGEPQPSREDFVRALMQRSRIVDDVRFQLPVEVYRLYLIEQATKAQPAPVAYIIERGLYGVTLDANSRPIMRVELSIRVLDGSRCREIPILSAALAWDGITVNGKPGALAAKAGWLVLMPDKPGVYELAATAKLGRQWADQARVALDVPRSVRSGVKFDAAGAWHVSAAGSTGLTASGATRTMDGSAGLTASASAEVCTHVDLAMPPTDRIDVAWTRPVILPPRPPQFEIGGAIAWNIDAGRQQISARMNVRILGGAADRLALAIPPEAVRCEITGPDVRDTRVSGGTAEVFLRGKVTGQTRLNISYELPNGPAGQGAAEVQRRPGPTGEGTLHGQDARATHGQDARATLPAPKLADGHWSGGTLVITNTAGASELIAGNIRSLREIYEGDIPADARAILAGKPVLAYEITARDFDASVEVLDLGEFALRESIADLAHYQVLLRPDGSIMCKVDYEIRNRTSQFLRVHMPAGAAVLSARVNDVPTALTPVAGEADVSRLPLVRSKASVKGLVSFPVQIVMLYRAAGLARRGLADVPLPTIDLPIAYGWCDLYAPEGMAVSQWSGTMRSVERLSSETAIASLGYGAGELAEGYREEKRIKIAAAPEAKPKPRFSGAPKNLPPSTRVMITAGAAQSLPIELPTVVTAPQPQPAAAPAPPKLPPAGPGRGGYVNGVSNLDTTVTVPAGGGTLTLNGGNTYTGSTTITGGTLLLGGQIAGQSLLAKNYYNAGKEYYEKGRYQEAAESLGNAARMAPGSVEADNAKRLLANIDVVQGKGKAASQQEKALGRQVQTEVAGKNVKLEQQQQELIEQAGVALKSGRLDEAQAAYKAAEGLGGQLLAKGAGKGEQDALLRQSRQELAQLEQEQSRQAAQVKKQYEHFKSSGEVTKALAIGNALKELSAEGEEKKALTGELEKLAIASVRPSDRADRVVMAGEAGKISRPVPDSIGLYSISGLMVVNTVPAPSGSITTGTTSRTRFTRRDGGNGLSWDAFTEGPSPRSPDESRAATDQLDRLQNRTEEQSTSTFWRAAPAGKPDQIAREAELRSSMELRDEPARQAWTDQLDSFQDRARAQAPSGQPAPDGSRTGNFAWSLGVSPRDVDVLKEQAKALRSQQKYDQALETVEQLLRIDPSDKWAANEKQVLTEFSVLKKDTTGFRMELTEGGKSPTEVRDANTPWYEYIRYPRNWKQLSESRKEFQAQAAGETGADAAIRDKLMREIERLSFADIDFKDVITFLREYSEVNIHVNWRALTVAGIEQTTKVSVDVRTITVKRALDLVLRDVSGSGVAGGPESELRYIIDGGVLTISTKADLAKEPIRKIYDIRDLLAPVPDFEGPRTELRQAGSGGWEMTKEKLMENLIAQVRNSIDPKSWADESTGPTAGTPGFVQILNGSLIVAQTPENQQAVAEFIERVRQAKAGQDRQAKGYEDHRALAQQVGQPAQPDAGVVTRVYDVRDLVIGSDGARTPEEVNRRLGDLAARATGSIRVQEGLESGEKVSADDRTSSLVVSAGPQGQRRMEDLLGRLREIRGPQVEISSNIAGQKARGLVKTGAGTLLLNASPLTSLTANVSYSGTTVVNAGTAVNTNGTFMDDININTLANAGAPALTDIDGDGIPDAPAQLGWAGQAGTATEATKAQLEDFIRRNYDWQISGTGHRVAGQAGGGSAGGGGATYGSARYDDVAAAAKGGRFQYSDDNGVVDQVDREKLVERLGIVLSSNIGQAVIVNSSNINVTSARASQLGIEFQQGVNSLRYATVDEAQLRTLRQLEARQGATGKAVAANPRLQSTIVGTEALLAGGQRAYVARALEGGNTFGVAGNPIDLSHEKYILIDAGGYLTAAKASQMQHWTQSVSKEDVGFADVPQELDVPRVGNLVRFEKTLIRPADRLTIRAEYTWKGAAK